MVNPLDIPQPTLDPRAVPSTTVGSSHWIPTSEPEKMMNLDRYSLELLMLDLLAIGLIIGFQIARFLR